jgi:beta-lactamase regulating signal transducer with metallopeptidase domain
MENVFLSVLNMSLTSSFIIAAIMLVRLPLKKAPKGISYALWAVAGFRLAFPFTLEGAFSLVPFKAAPIPHDIAMQAVPRIDSGITIIDNAVSASLPAAVPYAGANPLQGWIFIGSRVWLFGMAAMLVYSFVSIVLLKRRLRGAAHVEGSLFEAGNLKTPFVMGLFRPRIYIPPGLGGEEGRYIILHERTHIRRGDHIVKMLAYFILCLHWFNPLAWAAFALMGADMEMSCDERVMRELGGDIKNAYSLSLVRVAAGRRILNGSPLAFGEGAMRERVKNVLNFQKPPRALIIAAVAAVAVFSVCFAVNRMTEPLPWADVPSKSDGAILDMSFGRVTFGSSRDLIVSRWGREPDSEDVLADENVIYYRGPGVVYTPEGGEASAVAGGAFDVTYYLNGNDCIYKKQLHGVYRIDINAGNAGASGMAGGGMGREGTPGALEGVLDEYGGPNGVERIGGGYILWYHRPDDADKRLWFEVKGGELTGRMGIVCLCEGEGVTAADAVEQLVGSVTNVDGQILFQIPPRYYKPSGWNIHIAGRAEFEDGFSMSIHELEDENERHAWEAGKWYAIPADSSSLTALMMDVVLPDENGDAIEQSVDLLAVIPAQADFEETARTGIIPADRVFQRLYTSTN